MAKRGPSQSDLDALRGSLVTLIHRESGVTVVAPRVTTRQQERSAALLGKFLGGQASYDPPGHVVVNREWFVSYDATTVPESAALAWTADLAGGATASVVAVGSPYSTMELVDDQTTGHGLYTYSHGLSDATGATLEAWLRVADSDGVTGGLLRIATEAQRYDVRLLTGGLYIGDASGVLVTRDLTAFRTVRLAARSAGLSVYVDGQLAITGGPAATATESLVAWGNDEDAADCALEVVRIRAAEGV